MSSPLSLSTVNSLNRRPVKKEASPLNPVKSQTGVDYTRLDRSGRAGSASGVKREQEALDQHHGEERAHGAPHQTGQIGRFAQEPIKREQKPGPVLDHDDGRITRYLDKIDDRFPDNRKVHDDFLRLMNTHKSAEDALPRVSLLLERAPELVRDYIKLTDAFNVQWFRHGRPPIQSSPASLPTNPQSLSLHRQFSTQPTFDDYAEDSVDDDASASEDDGTDDSGSEVDANESTHMHPPSIEVLMEAGRAHNAQEAADIQKLLLLPEINIPPEQRKRTPRQMSCQLMEHQKVCLTWLIQQEQDNHKRGGLLADTMGLGKTVQALSLILARPSKDPACKTTLVVAPVALLKQWEREIQSKVKPAYKLKTYILHGPTPRGMTVSKLLSYDVVLTTYGKVASEYKTSPRQKTNKSPLLLANSARFHRIILDEAHNIKNRTSNRSAAVCELKATYRLCMTGTPFMNDTTEIFSLVRFLRISPYDSWNCFYPDIAKPIKHWDDDERSSAMRKLQVLFRSITLRRTKTSVLDGKQIIELPALAVEKSEVEFDEDQRAFYNALETKQRLEANKYLRAGLEGGNYAHILALLLRLRQACCHPHLIKDQGIPDGVQIDPEEMIELARRLREQIVARIRLQTDFQCPMCNIQTGNPIINYPCGHHICGGCFTTMMEMRHLGATSEDVAEPTCPQPGCSEKVEPDQVLCYNYFLEAYEDDGSEDSASGDDGDDEKYKHEDDADAQGNLKGFIVSDDGEDEGEAAEEEPLEEEDAKEESAEDDEDNNDFDPFKTSDQSVSETSEALGSTVENETKDTQHDPTEGEASDDSDSDSLPSIEEIRQRVFGQKLLVRGHPAKTKDDCTSHDSGSEVAITQGKRKRSPIDETNEPRKKAKTGGPSKQRKSKKGKGFQSLAALKKEASRNAAAKAKYLTRLRKDFVSSAKIDRTMEVLHAIRQENTREKTLVFSLWTSFLDLLEIPIHDHGFRYTRYDGSMPPKDRDAAVTAFMERPDVEVMLVSLMAGNAGLNLTAATRVVILEPFWNPFVEDQAIDRAHRIGQDRPVTVHRVLIAGTVEDRIQELQEKKRRLVNAALSEEGAQTTSRLSARELRGLFGLR